MSDFNRKGIYFLPLGGADEIGMNMFMYSINGKIIIVDAGYGFLADEYPGMDLAYASPEFLETYKEDIVGIFITYGGNCSNMAKVTMSCLCNGFYSWIDKVSFRRI